MTPVDKVKTMRIIALTPETGCFQLATTCLDDAQQCAILSPRNRVDNFIRKCRTPKINLNQTAQIGSRCPATRKHQKIKFTKFTSKLSQSSESASNQMGMTLSIILLFLFCLSLIRHVGSAMVRHARFIIRV
jgi:hypothetical protein